MFLYHQLHVKINERQFQNTFFKLGLVGDNETCQKNFFQSKNSNGSKQTAAKVCLQDQRRGFYFIMLVILVLERNSTPHNPCLPNTIFPKSAHIKLLR